MTAVAGVGLYFILFSALPALAGVAAAVHAPTDNLTTVTSREVLWQLSWQAIKSSPWLGTGPMHFATLSSEIGTHPHNWPLQIAAEWGLPALALLVAAILKLGNLVRHTVKPDNGLAVITLTVAVALSLGLVDGNLVMPVSQIAATLAVGMLIGAVCSRTRLNEQGWRYGAPVVLTAFLSATACGIVIVFATSTLPYQSGSIANFHQLYPGAWLVPRFWEQGNLP